MKTFYIQAIKYALDNLPVKDALLKSAKFVDFRSEDNATFSQVEFFVERLVAKYYIVARWNN